MRRGVVFKAATVEFVGAALGHVVDDGAGSAAVLNAEIVGDYADFVQGILVTEENRGACYRVVVIGLAVYLEIVRAATETV